jgi:hypothetical protein
VARSWERPYLKFKVRLSAGQSLYRQSMALLSAQLPWMRCRCILRAPDTPDRTVLRDKTAPAWCSC